MDKKLVLFALLLCLISVACKKKKDEPTPAPVPYLEMKFGYFPVSSLNMKPYLNQTTMPLDSIKGREYFGVSITELNHLRTIGVTTDSLVFKFNMQTANDNEDYISRKNTPKSGLYVTTWTTAEVGGEFGLPFKISSVAVKGNDTLEFSPSGDFVTLNYTSTFSTLKGSAHLNIPQ